MPGPAITLFGSVAQRLSSHPENIATEALCHILRHHAGAWPAIRRLLNVAGVEFPDRLIFQTQDAGGGDGIPDLTGINPADGSRPLVVEAKFWAGLTENQPASYVKRLPAEGSGLLLFVAPSARLAMLWDKIITLCPGLLVASSSSHSEGLRSVRLNDRHHMAIVSWRSLLECMRGEADQAGDQGLRSDVVQLQGLCDAMDQESFLPLQERDLSPEIGRRVRQYIDVVEDVVARLTQSNFGFSTKGVSTGGSRGIYGRFFYLKEIGGFLAMNPYLWSRGESPLWLQFQFRDPALGERWVHSPRITEALQRKFADAPSRTNVEESPAWISLMLPTGVERDSVVESLAHQIADLARLCSDAVTTRTAL